LEEAVISIIGTRQNSVGSRRVDLGLIHKLSVGRMCPKGRGNISAER